MPLLLHDPVSGDSRSLHISVITPPHVYTPCIASYCLRATCAWQVTYMGDDALIHVCSPVGQFARARCNLLFLVAMPHWREYDSSDKVSWQSDSWQDGSNNSNAWQSDDGNGAYADVQAAEGWGVRPGSGPQASNQLAWGSQQQWACRPQQQLACRPQQQLAFRPQQQLDCPLCSQPIPEHQPLTPDYESVYSTGYKAGYEAACEDWEQGYHEGEIDTHQMQDKVQDQGNQTNRR